MKQKLASSIPATLLSILVVAPSTMQGPPPPVQDPSKGTTGSTAGSTGLTSAPTTGGAPTFTKTAGPQVKTTGGKPPALVPPKPPKPPWQEFKLDPKATIFLDFTESSPDMVLSILSRTSGITIVRDPAFKVPITVTSAKAVKLDEAFEILNTVLGLNNYELRKQGNLLVVGKKMPPQPAAPPMMAPPPAEEGPVIKVYKLEYASASQVARVVNEVFSQQALETMIQQLQGGGGFNPGGPQFGRPGGAQTPKVIRASSDDYSNAVVVNAPAKLQVEVDKLIKELDKTTDKPLESEVFQLKYVGVDDVVDAIQNVLSANKPTGRGSAKSQDNQNSMYSFYGYNPFGSQNSRGNGGETVVSVKPTNSVIVSATKANMELVRQLVKSLDQESSFVGTTFVIHLENAKATDIATLLNQAFTKRRDQNNDDNPFFFYFSDYGGNQKKNDTPTDIDENGRVVNVRDLTGKVNVMADPNTNSLIVVTLPSNMKLIRNIVNQIDRISDQVMIETVIVEANLDKTTKLGIEWNFLQSKVLGNNGTSGSGSSNFGLQGGTTSPQGFTYTLAGRDYRVFLNALQTDTRFKVLSTPRIFTSNNVKAEINVSQQVPYITSQQTGAIGGLISQYDFKSVGVILTVTPRITSAGEVSMDVIQSADDLQGFTTFNAPIINHRQASTTASVKDGETIVLGGIIRTTYNNTSNKVPILGDIPLLGNLFKSSSKQIAQTELMVLLTPHIVRNSADAARLKEEEVKRLSKGSQDAVKKVVPPGGG